MVDGGKEPRTFKAGCGVLQGSPTLPWIHLETLHLGHTQHFSVPGTVACCQLLTIPSMAPASPLSP